MIPSLAILRFASPRRWGIPWPIPVFLLWIPALLLAPFAALILWIACAATHVPFWRSIAVFWGILCSLPGTDVRVCADGRRIQVRIV